MGTQTLFQIEGDDVEATSVFADGDSAEIRKEVLINSVLIFFCTHNDLHFYGTENNTVKPRIYVSRC